VAAYYLRLNAVSKHRDHLQIYIYVTPESMFTTLIILHPHCWEETKLYIKLVTLLNTIYRQCTFKCNTELCSRTHCCRAKAISITYSDVCVKILSTNTKKNGAAVPQWLRCFATSRKVAGSIPGGVIGFSLT